MKGTLQMALSLSLLVFRFVHVDCWLYRSVLSRVSFHDYLLLSHPALLSAWGQGKGVGEVGRRKYSKSDTHDNKREFREKKSKILKSVILWNVYVFGLSVSKYVYLQKNLRTTKPENIFFGIDYIKKCLYLALSSY